MIGFFELMLVSADRDLKAEIKRQTPDTEVEKALPPQPIDKYPSIMGMDPPKQSTSYLELDESVSKTPRQSVGKKNGCCVVC